MGLMIELAASAYRAFLPLRGIRLVREPGKNAQISKARSLRLYPLRAFGRIAASELPICIGGAKSAKLRTKAKTSVKRARGPKRFQGRARKLLIIKEY